MRKYLVATHGELARGFVDAVRLIAGSDVAVECFCMTKSKSGDEAEKEIRELIADCDRHEYVVFTDLFGGSVNNIFTSLLLEGYRFHLITGSNFPLLLEVLLSSEEDLEGVITKAVGNARDGIVYINERVKAIASAG